MTRYEKEYLKLESQRDKAILDEITLIFDRIRMQTQIIASDVAGKVEDDPDYLKKYGRNEKLAKEVNTTLRPDYLKKDALSKKIYEEEYTTAYIQSLYTVANTGIDDGYLLKLPKYTAKQFKEALNYPLSKLMNKNKMKTSRSVDIEQLYTTIISGVEQGLSLPKINRNIDKALGYRDSTTGEWIPKKSARKGQTYRTMRTLRTEVGRMRSVAETDQWINQQSIVKSELVWLATLDDKTRSQSAQMDGQVANENGEFVYPNGTVAKQRQSGNPAYDINDRCTTFNRDPIYQESSRIQRDREGNNTVQPYINFKEYAKQQGMKRNRYGEVLFSKK